MMAGLVAAREGVQAALGLSRADLALSAGRNELERIGRIGAARGIDEKQAYPGAFVRHMAVLATLAQGLTLPEARELAARERDCLAGPRRSTQPSRRSLTRCRRAAAARRRSFLMWSARGRSLPGSAPRAAWLRRALSRKPASRIRLGWRWEKSAQP